ncbi:MAG: PQQ-binding-like beta-propeller repeat protein [Planctomycetota bacterium]
MKPTFQRVFQVTVTTFLACILWTVTLRADSPEWSRFHGVDGNGVTMGKIPTGWTDKDYRWRRRFDSYDVGSPIVHRGRIYHLVSKPNQKIALESLDLATGQMRWSKEYGQRDYRMHKRNTLASSTPAADDENVFVCWADPTATVLKCFDHDGNEVWSRDFGTWKSQHGFGTSPRIFGSMVLLFNSQQADQLRAGDRPGQSRMIAVDRKSGDTLWETSLTTTRACYGIPAIYESGSTTQIIGANTGDGLFALDPKSGKMLWNKKVFEARSCSTPLIIDDVAIGSAGSGGGGNHLVAVRIPSRAGEKPEQLYRIDRGAPYVPTPVLKDGRLYMIDDRGIASCVDAKTGRSVWGPVRIGGNFGASPILIGDTLLMISLDGKATLLRAGDRYEKLAEVDLGGPVGATPAFAEGHLLLRVGDELRCIGPNVL